MNIIHKITKDGSSTLFVPELDEYYHSVHGAIQESIHVFIRMGFDQCHKNSIEIFELGFGTGLNAMLTFTEADKKKKRVNYFAIEKYPLQDHIINNLNYFRDDPVLTEIYREMNGCEWNKPIRIKDHFCLYKIHEDMLDCMIDNKFDLVYFDAFAPNAQPELWEEPVFKKLFEAMNPGGILVTYCAKGEVRRNMIKCGFEVERLPGPPGKREMLRSVKTFN